MHNAALNRVLGGVADEEIDVTFGDERQLLGEMVQCLESHFESRRNAATQIAAVVVNKVEDEAGAGLYRENVMMRIEREGADSVGNAVEA